MWFCEGGRLLFWVSRRLICCFVPRAGLTIDCECKSLVSAIAILVSMALAVQRRCFAVSQTVSGLL